MTAQARSAYRALLREIPRRNLNSQTTTPLHNRIRAVFRTTEESESGAIRAQEAAQMAAYARAQRSYAELVDRYNPGSWLDEEERIRLTARRVGMELPVLGGKS
ncbi:hypothetical protein ASPWEDRAFT_169416 [Aspergillus wentii DTO 134E9]|uniref:Uncharacterized protein n=1 Tax=Aspergillus wentii DTO 134E9 TaxID=1073089 RepID=A0A1L9RXL2_ASPWE|nr:uncharacterized protein ASPWEDRAFT_169416 [Aspergillus wentii DTO 134E9]KAI9931742.1 hypothetical protein MW887_010321 [Aspergillus wentii]OJJ39578.1 hypothetical protein ASPWEDRAFT_169416 [Aspergillus wentii DTO 134E9]